MGTRIFNLSDKLTRPPAWAYSRFHSRPGVFAVGEGGMAVEGIHQALGTYS